MGAIRESHVALIFKYYVSPQRQGNDRIIPNSIMRWLHNSNVIRKPAALLK